MEMTSNCDSEPFLTIDEEQQELLRSLGKVNERPTEAMMVVHTCNPNPQNI